MDLFSSVLGVFSFVEGIDTLQAVIFVAGLILLVIEMFIPGFGIAGGTGVVLLITGIFLTARTPVEALTMVVILVLLIGLSVTILLHSIRKGNLSKKLILWSAASQKDGFSTSADNSALIGQEGIALTVLRPAGSGEFAGQRLDVVTDGTFIESGTRIKIVRTEGRRIVVKPVE